MRAYLRTMGLKNQVFEKRKGFKEDFKELTEVACHTFTGSELQVVKDPSPLR